jgi:outer membrane protein TolC
MALFGIGRLREYRCGKLQNQVCSFFFAFALCAFSGNAFPSLSLAQQIPGNQTADPYLARTIQLSMRDAVRLALKQNPGLVAARLEALESKQETRLARSAFLPKASLALEEQMNRLNLATLIGQEQRPYSIGPYSNVQLGSTFDVPLLRSLRGRTTRLRSSGR